MTVYFWQLMVSPHIVELAYELSELNVNVKYCAVQKVLPERLNQGWDTENRLAENTILVADEKNIKKVLDKIDHNTIHICQGIRGNGLISLVQRELVKRGQKYWIIMETVQTNAFSNFFKLLVYRSLFKMNSSNISGVFAIGRRTPNWLISSGISPENVYPFAYFLRDANFKNLSFNASGKVEKFRFIFIGRLIRLKRVDWIIHALSRFKCADFELVIVGNGDEMGKLQKLAFKLLRCQVSWLGVVPNTEIPCLLSSADCLVLPSSHDGWGAVISESLLMGTPVVCSDSCGASVVVNSTGFGRVFNSSSLNDLTQALKIQLENGKISIAERLFIMEMSKPLGAKYGAQYLKKILLNITPLPTHPMLSK